MDLNTFYYILSFIVGISFGSFMNVLVYRIPNGISLINPPSTCPSCNNQLKWYHNIPVFSWIFLGAKCGFCKEKIPVIYPSLELITGILGVFTYWFGKNYMHLSEFQIFALFLYFYLYLSMSIIDYKTHLVSDLLNIPALVISVFIVWNTPQDILVNIGIALGVGAFFYFGIVKGYSKLRGIQVMGEGDVPILMGMAAVLGIEGFLMSIFVSALAGGVLFAVNKKNELPYIPALTAGMFITLILKYAFGISNMFFFLQG